MRQVDDDAPARRIGQKVQRRNDDFPPDSRIPRVDAGVGRHELGVADVEMPRDVREDIALPNDVATELAHRLLSGRKLVFRRRGRECRQHGDQRECGEVPARTTAHGPAAALPALRQRPDHRPTHWIPLTAA